MNASQFSAEILRPSLERVLPIIRIEPDPRAERLLLAIAGQESGWAWRYQLIGGPESGRAGPARGWWQFERMGGVWGVMNHPSSRTKAKALCAALHVYWDEDDIWRALEGHDALATGFARLLLWTDARPLPTGQAAAWRYYTDNWRPGRAKPNHWAANWSASVEAVS
jgi:hypothetical protein